LASTEAAERRETPGFIPYQGSAMDRFPGGGRCYLLGAHVDTVVVVACSPAGPHLRSPSQG